MKYFLLLFLLLLLIYHPWFSFSKTVSSGDWPYLFLENIKSFGIFPNTPFIWLEPYYQLSARLGVLLGLSWEHIEKIFWFFPFMIISLISSGMFMNFTAKLLKIKAHRLFFTAIGSLIFTTNTYVLMMVGGGQMGVAIAYSLMPFVLLSNIKYKISNIKNIFWGGLVGGIQLMFDPRIFLLTLIVVFAYAIFISKEVKKFFMSLTISILLNLFWIIPNISFYTKGYANAIDAASASFLSFATFSNSISLLHPNWPENIFGKIGFMKPEFLILPILAYSSLAFLKNKIVLFFSLLGLLGAFLAKGTNPPFGEVYLWLSNIPGFLIFRDPTKFYLWIVLSYSVLIPFSLSRVSEKVSGVKYRVLSIGFLAFWLITIYPAVFGQLGGTFKPQAVPREYIELKNYLSKKPEIFVTLWIPRIQRFGFSSASHPAINAEEFFHVSSLSGVLNSLKKEEAKKMLIDSKVKYVIVPYDSKKELFIDDRKYQPALYGKTLEEVGKIKWLKEVWFENSLNIKVFLVF